MRVHDTSLHGVGALWIPALLSLSACSGDPEPAQDSDSDLALRGCVRRQPALRLDPKTSDSVTHGTTVTYTLSLTNRDNPRCAPAQFLYGEWDSPDRLQVDAPGDGQFGLVELAPRETVDLELQVTSLPDSQPGALQFQILATQYSAAESPSLHELIQNSTKVQGVYQLVGTPPCQRRPPTFTVTPSIGPAVPLGTPVDFEARVVNNDVGECPPQTFNYGVPPMQWGEMSPPPPGIRVEVPFPSTAGPGVGTFLDVPPGGSAVGAFQVVGDPPLEPGITEFPVYLGDPGAAVATVTVGYHVAD